MRDKKKAETLNLLKGCSRKQLVTIDNGKKRNFK